MTHHSYVQPSERSTTQVHRSKRLRWRQLRDKVNAFLSQTENQDGLDFLPVKRDGYTMLSVVPRSKN